MLPIICFLIGILPTIHNDLNIHKTFILLSYLEVPTWKHTRSMFLLKTLPDH
jgi:hypothetical protein